MSLQEPTLSEVVKDSLAGVIHGPFWAPKIENALNKAWIKMCGEPGPQDEDVWVIEFYRKGDPLDGTGARIAVFPLSQKEMADLVCLRLNQKDAEVRKLDIYQKGPCCHDPARVPARDGTERDVYEIDGRFWVQRNRWGPK